MVHVELHFPFSGTKVAAVHGYALYSAISKIVPEAHNAEWLAITTLRGIATGDGTLRLDSTSALKIRLPQDRIPLLLQLAGKRLEMDGHAIRLGAPRIHLLKPASVLYARTVTIKGYREPEPFAGAVRRKLDELRVAGNVSVGPRHILKVADQRIVGFAVAVSELTDEASLVVQERGIGGRRRMGCGIFFPVSRLPFDTRNVHTSA